MDEVEHHRWAETKVRALIGTGFPAVCMRCLVRSDSPEAERPCDRSYEKWHNSG